MVVAHATLTDTFVVSIWLSKWHYGDYLPLLTLGANPNLVTSS